MDPDPLHRPFFLPSSRPFSHPGSTSRAQLPLRNGHGRPQHAQRSACGKSNQAEKDQRSEAPDRCPEQTQGQESESDLQTAACVPEEEENFSGLDVPVARDHLRYFHRVLFPTAFAILFIIAATTLFIYTFGLKKAVSRRFMKTMGILFATVIGLWVLVSLGLYFRAKHRAYCELERVDKARNKAQQELERDGAPPEPRQVSCPLRKRSIQAALYKAGRCGWLWATRQPTLLNEKWKAHRKAKAKKRQKAFGIKPNDEENIPPTPVPASAPIGGLLDVADCSSKRISTFDNMPPSTYNQEAAPERSLPDRVLGKNKFKKNLLTPCDIEAKNQEKIDNMFRERKYATFDKSAQDFDVHDPVDRPVLQPRNSGLESKIFGAGRHYDGTGQAAISKSRSRAKPHNLAESSKIEDASTPNPQQYNEQVQDPRSARQPISKKPVGSSSRRPKVLGPRENLPVVGMPSMAGSSKKNVRAELHTRAEEAQSPSSNDTPPAQHSQSSRAQNATAPTTKSHITSRNPALRRKQARVDLKNENVTVSPMPNNLVVNMFLIPTDAALGLAAIKQFQSRQEAFASTQEVSKSDHDLSKIYESIVKLDPAWGPPDSRRKAWPFDIHSKPSATEKALSDLPEMPSPVKLAPPAFSGILFPERPAQQANFQKQMSDKNNMRWHPMKRRSDGLLHRIPFFIDEIIRRAYSAMYEEHSHLFKRSKRVVDDCESATGNSNRLCPESCQASTFQSKPDDALTVAPLKFPTRRLSQATSKIAEDGENVQGSLVVGSVIRLHTPEAGDTSPMSSVDMVSGSVLKVSEEEMETRKLSVAPQLAPIGVGLREKTANEEIDFTDGNWI
ncbi:hypothetical protein WAI453_002618 [Rhynchosporium graminicola]